MMVLGGNGMEKNRQRQSNRKTYDAVVASRITTTKNHPRENRKNNMVWIPPKAKDRQGIEADEDDYTEARDQRGQSQQQKHHAVLGSMDLMVDAHGFLIPRKCKKAADEVTVDNGLSWNDDENDGDDSEESSSSSDDQSSSQEEGAYPNNASLSSIPYCMLVPDGLDDVKEQAPQTPSGHQSRNAKSIFTLETEAMTRTLSDSQSDMFASPRPPKYSNTANNNTFQSPPGQQEQIPTTCAIQRNNLLLDLISPLAEEPSPSGGKSSGRLRDKPRMSTNNESWKQRYASTATNEEKNQEAVSGDVLGLTSPGGSSTTSKSSRGDSRRSFSSGKSSKEGRKKKAAVIGSPVISTSRISMVAKQMASPPLACRSPGYTSTAGIGHHHPSRQNLQRHRSDSAADPTQRSGKPMLVNNQSSISRGVNRTHSEPASKKKDPAAPHTPAHKSSRERQRKTGTDRHFVPGNVEDILRDSPKLILHSPTAAAAAASSSPRNSARTTNPQRSGKSPIVKTPSSSSRDTARTLGLSLSSSTGRGTLSSAVKLESHFQHEEDLFLSPSSKSPSRRSRRQSQEKANMLLDQIGALDLLEEDDSLDEDISSAGAVIIQTRKVLKKKTSISPAFKNNQKRGSRRAQGADGRHEHHQRNPDD